MNDRRINNSHHQGWYYFFAVVVDNIEFFRGHTDSSMSQTSFQIDKHTHIHMHTLQKTFHDIIGFIRSRPKQESSPLAGLMSMLSTAEGEVVDQNSALLLSPHFSLSLWVGHITAE